MSSSIELAQAYVQIIPSATGIKSKITSELGGEVDEAGEELGTTMGESMGDKAASLLKTAIVAACTYLTTEVLTSIVEAGAALEQSIGGIETIYGDAADAMKEYAQAAYETAGISANEYMEQATSFGAALVSSLGGDTSLAAYYADMAIQDMADNANKFGTDMESIQNAYQGFAKQNYTMLDNLKLGYGGTQEEMERLLADAQELSGVEYDIDNLSDVYAAIHVIQQELGVTGTTAEEAASTISGSLASMKAAAENLIGYMAIGADIEPYLTALIETTCTFLFENLVPMLGNIIAALPSALATFLSSAVEIGTEMMENVVSGVAQSAANLIDTVLPMVTEWTGGFRENFSEFVSVGMELVLNLVEGIMDGLPTLIANVPLIVSNIAGLINDNMPTILSTGIDIVLAIAEGLLSAIPTLIANVPEIVAAIVDVITATNWLQLGASVLTGFVEGISSMISTVAKSGSEIASTLLSNVSALPAKLLSVAASAVSGFASTFLSYGWKSLAATVVSTTVQGLTSLASSLSQKAKEAIAAFKEKFTATDWKALGSDILNGIGSGITSAISSLVSAAKNACSSVLSSVKSFFGIASPSKLMRDEVGAFLPEGMAVGISANLGTVKDAMGELNDAAMSSMDAGLYESASYGYGQSLAASNSYATTTNMGGVTINVNAPEGASAKEIAQEVSDIIQKQSDRRKAAFA